MTDRLKGKTCLVTAAGQGIGRAIAEAFVREGGKVIATDVDAAKVKDLKGADGKKLDVRNTAEVEKLASETGAIDVLANCAGYVHHGSVLECSEADWDFSFDL
ncbi:MAG TPA: SDR family NAD(P)-dependent oxidoreductase, partial [Xanthobacteraceae bacterium]